MMGRKSQIVALAEQDQCVIGLAQATCRLGEAVENRLHIDGRGRDGPKDIAGCGLPSQRLFEIPRARLHLVEEAHVFDRDDGLVGEGLQEVDLALGE